jgi:protein-S-isoprenylcysteine O-methyltransferase Ste14
MLPRILASEEAAMSRFGIFLYGVSSYALSMVVFVYATGFIGGFITPTMLDGPPRQPLGTALGLDIGLVMLFALQHSIMARPAFKRWWTRFVPEAAERSTYVLLSSLAMLAIFVFWSPLGGVIWQLSDGLGRQLVIGVYLLGWLLLFYTTFLIDHFDLLGLKQVWRHVARQQYRPPRFYTPSLYKLVRHPLYIGWLTIFWAAPTMTSSHLLFAVLTTAYILIAIPLEEHDLVEAFGADYTTYRQRTPMLVPRLRGSQHAVSSAENQAGV